MANKRESKRHKKRFMVKFGTSAERRTSFTKDISPEGLFLETAQVIDPGTFIQMDLILKDNSLVVMEGLVMWARKTPARVPTRLAKGGMGVKITKVIQGAEAFNGLCEHLAGR
jgi:hypothetical protein